MCKGLWQEAVWYICVAKLERTSVGTRFWREVMIPAPISVFKFVIKILISVSGVMSNYCRALAGREHAQMYVFLKGHSLQFGAYIADSQAWM